MYNIVLFEPEIPTNTGNIMRLCVNIGCKLHLIEPLGFTLDDKSLRRAGLDYKEKSVVSTYENFDEYQAYLGSLVEKDRGRIFLCSTKATTIYSDAKFEANDSLIFGPETRGLPKNMLDAHHESQKIKIPMREKIDGNDFAILELDRPNFLIICLVDS